MYWLSWFGDKTIYSFIENKSGSPSYGEINSDYYDTLGMSSLIAKYQVPMHHRRLALNYMTIKRIFGFAAVPVRPTNLEISLLKHYNFPTLEYATIRQINQELESIKKWANSNDEILRKHADQIFEIRVKELKYFHATKYFPSVEIYNGYKALEKYIEFIAG